MKVVVKLMDVISFLERMSGNTDTDPYWKAATELRKVEHKDLIEWVLKGEIAEGYKHENT